MVRETFSHLTLSDAFLNRLGPAVCSGHPIFLYGPPGNGKTSIAETIGKVLPGTVFVPHAIVIDGQIITVYDAITHKPIPEDSVITSYSIHYTKLYEYPGICSNH